MKKNPTFYSQDDLYFFIESFRDYVDEGIVEIGIKKAEPEFVK